MQGKRSYAVLRKFLLQACQDIETKGLRLAERLFIPDRFERDCAARSPPDTAGRCPSYHRRRFLVISR
jgi:hypothetical protein